MLSIVYPTGIAFLVTGSMPIFSKNAPKCSVNYSAFLKLYDKDYLANYFFFSSEVKMPPAAFSLDSMKLIMPKTIDYTDQSGFHVSG